MTDTVTAQPDDCGPEIPAVGADARRLLARAKDLRSRIDFVLDADAEPRQAVRTTFEALRQEMVRRDLATIPVERLKDSTAGRLRLSPLAAAGFKTVLDVLDAPGWKLLAVPGVGQQTVTQIHGAARQVASAIEYGLKFRVDLDPANQRSTALLIALCRLDAVHRAAERVRPSITSVGADLATNVPISMPASGRIRWLFTGGRRKGQATESMARIASTLRWADSNNLWQALDGVAAIAREAPTAERVWQDFERRSPEYYGLLGELVDLKLDVAAAAGFLPAEIVARVHEQQLDETFRTVSLRGYQSFGAKFSLVQRRVIIGDEMGLGKTIQAIAAITHLRATGGTHFLVVCPASVLINWTRELRDRSTLTPYRLHGLERESNRRRWISRGDVGVTTYESLRALTIPDSVTISMLVVDEAHYAKNPAAQRSRNVNTMVQRADRVLFLTGTPMENRVEEFKNLVGYLQPHVVPYIQNRYAIAGPDVFRTAVAPVYLRRNQEDVLAELPELIQVDEWEEFGPADFAAYQAAVAQGNFMAMRRAAFASSNPVHSAKLQRLIEIADEAGDNGHKVIVFSYFRDVLAKVHSALGPRALGPLTSDVPPAKRQALVDTFTRADGRSVLVSQIQAGGVGLNMQAASVIVLCEPQVKPTMEAQAVARAHRMGQVRSVQVHRLLTRDSVDQRMLEVLDSKTRLFNEYARRSDVAASSSEAMDISEVALAREVVAKEQERLAMELMARD